jgi:hypothetical protein
VPQQTTILGAAKLTGRLGKFSFGALNAVTPTSTRTIATARRDASSWSNRCQLLGRPGAARVRQPVDARLHGDDTRAPDRRVHRLPAGAGVHRRRRLGLRAAEALRVQGYWAGSSVHGDAERSQACRKARSTASSVPTRITSRRSVTRRRCRHAGSIVLEDRRLEGALQRRTSGSRSPGFDINDVGFLRRADTRSMSNWLQWRNDTPSKYLRSFRWNLNQWGTWNHGGDRLDLGGNVNAHWTFTNQWSTGWASM